MKKSIYAVYDEKVNCFFDPVYFVNDDVCLRNFMSIFHSNPDHPFAIHPGDYTVFRLGSFDPDSGLITSEKSVLKTMVEIRGDYIASVPSEPLPLLDPQEV